MINLIRALVISIGLFLSLGCSSAGRNDALEIDSYSRLLGIKEPELTRMYGQSRIIPAKIAMHDSSEDGLRLLVDNESVLLRLRVETVISASFTSPAFRTARGVTVGQTYCSVSKAYPEAVLSFGFSDGGFVRLVYEEKKIVFEFSTVGLPFDQYILEGFPTRDDPALCNAELSVIGLK